MILSTVQSVKVENSFSGTRMTHEDTRLGSLTLVLIHVPAERKGTGHFPRCLEILTSGRGLGFIPTRGSFCF